MTTLTEPRTSSVPEVWLAPTTVMACRQVVTRAWNILLKAEKHIVSSGDLHARTILLDAGSKLHLVSDTLAALYHIGGE